jgi:hypothetical protein
MNFNPISRAGRVKELRDFYKLNAINCRKTIYAITFSPISEQAFNAFWVFVNFQFFGIPRLPQSQGSVCTVFLFFSVFCFFSVISPPSYSKQVGFVTGILVEIPFPNPRWQRTLEVPRSGVRSDDAGILPPWRVPASGL